MKDLARQKCVPCEVGTPPLTPKQAAQYQKQVDPAWRRTGNKFIAREFEFKDFKQAMVFVNKIADIAEAEGHHPDITVIWNKVTLRLTTHKIKGLSPNDFIVAAKVDKIMGN